MENFIQSIYIKQNSNINILKSQFLFFNLIISIKLSTFWYDCVSHYTKLTIL